MGINYRPWKEHTPYFGKDFGENDPIWQRIIHSMMVRPNHIPKRFGRSPMFYHNFKPKASDLAIESLMPKTENLPLNLESNIYESPEIQSTREGKRNEPKKDGKDAKGDFDSNSYFMLRPLRREPVESYETPIMSAILGKYKI